jgi:putative hydrolase of the HAD superfamily
LFFLPWENIDTVLLDMDGTLLDLHYDNVFWMNTLPEKLAQQTGASIEESQQKLYSHYERVMGTKDWYCLNYWASQLNMDILSAKREVQHLIRMRDDTIPFLDALKQSGRRITLLTNAHPDTLALKLENTELASHISEMISTHEFGVTKESQQLWKKVQQRLGFDPERTLFVDDSLTIVEAAKTFGIKYLLSIVNPDSQQPDRLIDDFPAVADYRHLTKDIIMNPVNK